MSKATKRKYVTKEVLDDYVLPEGNNRIVQVGVSSVVIAKQHLLPEMELVKSLLSFAGMATCSFA